MGREDILLKEYETCQYDIVASGQHYWTLAGIFIGICSALLAAVVFGVLANDTLLEIVLADVKERPPVDRIATGLTGSLLGTTAIIILYTVWRWLGRVRFLQQMNFQRMREIELELGISRSWRVHAIDRWNEMRDRVTRAWSKIEPQASENNEAMKIEELIWNSLKLELRENLSEEDCQKLEKRKDELIQLCKRYLPEKIGGRSVGDLKYEGPSRDWFYQTTLLTVGIMWALVVLGSFVILLYHSIGPLAIFLGIAWVLLFIPIGRILVKWIRKRIVSMRRSTHVC